jgi:uncharacterized protein with ParB-like and HNH nuclease domain
MRSAGNLSLWNFFNPETDEHRKISSSMLTTPEFQRNYVWDKSKVENLIKSVSENDSGYYLGNIVTIAGEGGSSSRDLLVDGQQRLVTLTLICKALSETIGDAAISEKIKQMIFAGSFLRLEFKRDKLDVVYGNIIRGVPLVESELDDAESRFFENYISIKKLLLEVCPNPTAVDFLNKILSLEFVVIKCGNDDDAYQLFEGLNSTGLSLSAVELTKNIVLGGIKRGDPNLIASAYDSWEDIQSSFEENDSIWLDKFLRHHFFINFGYVGNGAVFKSIKEKYIKNKSAQQIFEYVKSLQKDAELYLNLRQAELLKSKFSNSMAEENWKSVSEKISLIKELGLDQIYGVLYAMFKYGFSHNEYFDRGTTLLSHINSLWAFAMIAKYTKVSPSSYERKFATFCKKICDLNYADFKARSSAFFVDLRGLVENLENEFVERINKRLDYAKDSRVFCRYILREYLLSVGAGSDERVTCEHIVPENDRSLWTAILDDSKTGKFVNKLGNLTLLDGNVNESEEFKISDFTNKNNIGFSTSRFTENNLLKEKWGTGFMSGDPVDNAISPRGKAMATSLYRYYKQNLN